MTKRRRTGSPAVMIALALAFAPGVAGGDFPWPAEAPERHGLSSVRLEAFKSHLAARNTRALLVIRRDKIVYEWYAPGSGPNQLQGTASLAKALVGGMSLLVALHDKRLRPDDLAWKYIPAWKQDPRKSGITIRHLVTHSSGIEDAEEDHKPHAELSGWKGDFWKRRPDPFSIAIHQAPLLFAPGTRYQYSNPGMAALAYAVTASLKGAPATDIGALLKERILDPLGVPESHWAIGYGQAYEVDGMKLYANWGGGRFTPRATARVGQLMLHQGRWDNRQLVEADWVRRAAAYAGTPLPERRDGEPNPGSGLGWWTNFDGAWPKIPRDAFAGAGAGHQVLLVVPSLDLIVVRNGGPLAEGAAFWRGVVEHLFDPLAVVLPGAVQNPPAVRARSQAPYPPSPLIRGVRFAPEAAIVRQAIDSDNWPITWGDDGDLYTSYGDGWGFDPRTGRKLSMGFARITGPAAQFRGINIRSESGERTGDGPKGEKASGMLMAGGVLYMWVRNTGNSQLAWSQDRGQTWQWGFRFDTSFGSPAFLNFGKNYRGARDGYVYVYSQDGPSAYKSDDSLALARAPQDRMRERDAYEFFVRLDESGRPVWTSDINQRGAAFRFPGHCQRVDVVYNPAIRRYLLALGYNHGGGWGIFDSAEPWGPWTTAFHTDDWGLGGTHGYRLPTKWITRDGKTMSLIFSGVKPNDAFCLRRLSLDMAR